MTVSTPRPHDKLRGIGTPLSNFWDRTIKILRFRITAQLDEIKETMATAAACFEKLIQVLESPWMSTHSRFS